MRSRPQLARPLRHPAAWLALGLALATIAPLQAAPPPPLADWRQPATNAMANLDQEMELLRARFHLPSLAAAMVSSEAVLAAGVAGVRKEGGEERATLADKYHIGSLTKSMTALMVAARVARGDWTPATTVGQVLDWELPEDHRSLTLAELLQHRSGLPRRPPEAAWRGAWSRASEPGPEQRRSYILDLAAHPIAPGARGAFEYSNQNYSLLGAMLETAASKPWETLVFDEVLHPLRMASAGIGPPATPDDPHQPWGHLWRDGKPVPAPHSDNPSAIGPGGKVHCHILDFAVYASHILALAREEQAGRATGKRGAALRQLFEPPPGGEYAWGWNVVRRGWAGGRAITHTGSNTLFFAVAWIAPNRDRAFVAVTNLGGDQAAEGCDKAIARMIELHLP